MTFPSDKDNKVFVSYASKDEKPVKEIIAFLEQEGVPFWRDQEGILGSSNYGTEIVSAIETCKAVILMCSAASMRSRNVKQEIQLAWAYEKPYLPLLLDDSISSTFPKQVQYWLEGCQWIMVYGRPPSVWLPSALQSLKLLGMGDNQKESQSGETFCEKTSEDVDMSLSALYKLASFTDRIWPVAADSAKRGLTHGATRGLGAPQPDVKHGHQLGSRLRIVIESDVAGHLLLLDQGPEGITYCLCPSQFAPDTRLEVGRTVLPQPQSPCDSFIVTGVPGRERILAIVTKKDLGLGWASQSSHEPARVLSPEHEKQLVSRLRELEPDQWVSFSTYFELVT